MNPKFTRFAVQLPPYDSNVKRYREIPLDIAVIYREVKSVQCMSRYLLS